MRLCIFEITFFFCLDLSPLPSSLTGTVPEMLHGKSIEINKGAPFGGKNGASFSLETSQFEQGFFVLCWCLVRIMARTVAIVFEHRRLGNLQRTEHSETESFL